MENGCCHVRRYTELWICSIVNESVNLFVEEKKKSEPTLSSIHGTEMDISLTILCPVREIAINKQAMHVQRAKLEDYLKNGRQV